MFNRKTFAVALGATWGLAVFLLGLAAMSGYGNEVVRSYAGLYRGFRPDFVGAVIGGIWGFVYGVVFGYVFAHFYNYFGKKIKK